MRKLSEYPWMLGLLLASSVLQAATPEVMTEDKGHVYRWNKFADDLYLLHKEQIKDRDIRKEVSKGGYSGRPAHYEETRYFDADSGRLLSVVQRELANPDNIHSIAVNRYDDQGRLARDYSATYLPDYRNAPTQTLIFIHRYPEGVHAFRSFDASDELLYERCEGEFNGEKVFFGLDIDEIEAAMRQRYTDGSGILTEPVYLHCFGDMPDSAKSLLPPR